MIECGWCGRATPTEGLCVSCRRDPVLPWAQRGQEPAFAVVEHDGGRPRLDPSQVRQRLRIARKDLGDDATNAELAEHLEISERTLNRWQKVSA